MYGHRYFGARYFGPRYWGDGGSVVPPVVVPPTGADAWPDPYRAPRPDRDRRKEECDKKALRELLEALFDGPKPPAVAKVLRQFSIQDNVSHETFGVDWTRLLADLGACERALRAYGRRLDHAKEAESKRKAVAVDAMLAAIAADRAAAVDRETKRSRMRRELARSVFGLSAQRAPDEERRRRLRRIVARRILKGEA